MAGSDRIPIPSLLACAAVHHHLIRTGLRTSVGLVVESGEPREVHHFACLAGYGAEAINPYLAFETIIAMKDRLPAALDDYEIVKRYIKSIGKGLLKVMSKMGISTYQSYCGAQIFDAVGPEGGFRRKIFCRHPHQDRRRGPGRNRRGNRAPSCRRVRRGAGLQDRARCRRRICLPHPRRGSRLDRRICLDAAARGARQFAGALQGVRQNPQRAVGAAADPARLVQDQDRRGREAQAGSIR